MRPKRLSTTLALAVLAAPLLLSPLHAQAQAQAPAPATSVDERRLRDEIKREILDELRNSDFLRLQIEAGIRQHLQQEEAARNAAAAERVRAANERFRTARPVTAARDHVFGNPDAPISLIEYSDFECPFCKRFHATPRQVVEASGGMVNWVYRHLPLAMHNPGAAKQAEAAECASSLGGSDAFWKFTDAVYLRTRSGGGGFPLAGLQPLAAEIGLDAAAFQRCVDSGTFAARVQEDAAEAARLGVTGTPTTLVRNNRTGAVRPKAGAVTAAAIQAEIELLLK